MQERAEDKAKHKRESLQLRRLARMIDVVYAIIIWRVFMILPRPTIEQLNWEQIGAFLIANFGGFLAVIIGIIVTIIYWIQNNTLLGNFAVHRQPSHNPVHSATLFFAVISFIHAPWH